MKATIVLLLFNIIGPIQSYYVTETELIGTWRVEKVRIRHSGICPRMDFDNIIDSEMEFTDDYLLRLTSNDEQESTKRAEKLSWSLRGGELILKSSSTGESHIWKYSYNGKKLTFQVTNLVELILKKK